MKADAWIQFNLLAKIVEVITVLSEKGVTPSRCVLEAKLTLVGAGGLILAQQTHERRDYVSMKHGGLGNERPHMLQVSNNSTHL